MPTLSEKRIKKDIQKLIEANPTTKIIKKNEEISFKFLGPKDTYYRDSVFEVNIYLPKNYPFKSPSIAFKTKIYHPNIDNRSGAICLNVINETWSPTYSLLNIYEMFLPQLLTYPNPDDPLNREAAVLYKTNRRVFASKVKEYICIGQKQCSRFFKIFSLLKLSPTNPNLFSEKYCFPSKETIPQPS